ncbi:MAG: aldo/keto reductase [Salinirussus sp.]
MHHPFRIGLGTAGHSHDECVESVVTALDLGYRHLDTAQLYGTEAAVGEGLARSTVPRSRLTVATKVHPENMAAGDLQESVYDSRERLGVDVIDLLYVHWPVGQYDPNETLPAIADLQSEGIVREIGVSNFTPKMLAEARDVLPTPIYAHQIEMHPLLWRPSYLEEAHRHDYWLVAYSPLARGAVFDVPEIRDIAEKHGVSPAQVSLAWLLAKDNVAVVPKATGRDHLRNNFDAASLSLDPDDVDTIESIDRTAWMMNQEDSQILSRYGAHPQRD